jgi:membrane-bound metal-dependent hydrolase YbcI (DUF457 family)
MTQVGHILTGVACGVLSLPPSVSKARCVIQLGVFMVLANIPDIPLPYWGHARYDISHSVFVNLVPCALVLVILFRLFRDRVADWRTLGFGMAAWFSHLLLDAFYNHGSGVGIFWPLSTATVALPIPWFSVLVAPIWPLTAEGIRIGLIEFISYAPVVLMTLYIRNRVIVSENRSISLTYRLLALPDRAFSEASMALKKLVARTRTGISYKDYTPVLGEATFSTDMFLEGKEAKDHADLAKSFRTALAHYEFANDPWQNHVDNGSRFPG